MSGVTSSRAGWLKPGVSAIRPPDRSGSSVTVRVVCLPRPMAEMLPIAYSGGMRLREARVL